MIEQEGHEHSTHRVPIDSSARPDLLRRLAYIEGHLNGVRRMIEEDQYCVDVLKQTYAVRRAIEKMEALILENHLQGCVIQGIRDGRESEVVAELIDLYEIAGR
ncbi:MAG TPA: metal-sensitive transcriptional regulator [Dehalococcoidia bacterium]|nr:metal-sensitive transcriptional regulator [Dehalococcoidia bacterium]